MDKGAARRIEGILITHAHEDHIGALGHLWNELRAPIYCRAFTAHIARLKLNDALLTDHSVYTLQAWPEMKKLGPFEVGFVPVSHSIPESSSLVIDTPVADWFIRAISKLMKHQVLVSHLIEKPGGIFLKAA